VYLHAMSDRASEQQRTTPDLVARWQRAAEATQRSDFHTVMSDYAPDAVWDASLAGVGTFQGVPAIRRFLEDWIGNYEEYEYEQEAGLDLGYGVVFVVGRVDGRPAGSMGKVQERWAFTSVWVAGRIVRVTVGNDIDAARTAAERLAQERARG
jgi:ketosteroid isomerase-like protein